MFYDLDKLEIGRELEDFSEPDEFRDVLSRKQ